MPISNSIGYVEAISMRFPGVFVSCSGNPMLYEDVLWEGGEPLPAKSVLDVILIEMIKEEVAEKIKAFRDHRKTCGIMAVVDGKEVWFHSDSDSRIQFLGLKDKARDMVGAGGAMDAVIRKLGNDVIWKPLSQKGWVPMTCQLAFDIVEAVGDLDALLFAACEQHKWAMEASANPAQYDYTSNYWPEQFLS